MPPPLTAHPERGSEGDAGSCWWARVGERGIDSQESKRGLAVGVECRLDGCVNQTPHRMGTLVPRWPSDQTMMCAPVCARGPVAQTSMNSQPASLRIDGWHGTVLAIVWLLFLRRISSLALARSPTQENGSHCVTSDIVDLRRPHTRSDRFDRSSTRSTILLPEFETHTDAWLSGTRERERAISLVSAHSHRLQSISSTAGMTFENGLRASSRVPHGSRLISSSWCCWLSLLHSVS